jgi:hypothetical protein
MIENSRVDTRRRNLRIVLFIIILGTLPLYFIGFVLWGTAPSGNTTRGITTPTATFTPQTLQPTITGTVRLDLTAVVTSTLVSPLQPTPIQFVPGGGGSYIPPGGGQQPPPIQLSPTPVIIIPTSTLAPTLTPYPTLTPIPLPTSTTIPVFPTDPPPPTEPPPLPTDPPTLTPTETPTELPSPTIDGEGAPPETEGGAP